MACARGCWPFGGRTRTRRAIARALVVLPAVVCGGALLALAGCSRRPEPGAPIPVERTIGGIGDTPGRFTYPRGIDRDPVTHTLWVVDRSGRIQELDPVTGRCLTIIRLPRTELGFPVGLTIAPGLDSRGQWSEHMMYVPDTHYNRVMVFDPPTSEEEARKPRSPDDPPRIVDPVIARQVGTYGTGDGQFIYPTDVCVLLSPDKKKVERIYISEYGGNDRVSVYDADLKFQFSFGAFGSSAAKDKVEFNRPQEVWLDHDAAGSARLVIVDARNHRIGRFTLDGALIGWIGSPDSAGREPGQFLFPWSLSLLGDGTALVAEFQGCRVQRVNLETGASLGIYGHAGLRDGELNSPWAMTRLDDEIFLVDARNNRVVGFRPPS